MDQRWGPLNDEDISLFLRRINFKEIIALHTKNIKHTLQKCENVSVYRITSQPEIKPYHTIPIHLNGILLRTFKMVCKKKVLTMVHKKRIFHDGILKMIFYYGKPLKYFL